MESEDDTKVIMISSDGERFEISKKAAMRSKIVKDCIFGNNEDRIEFMANGVKGADMKKVVEYLEHYKDEEPKLIDRPLPSSNFKECVDEWDYNFIDLELGTIFDISLAANYLDIQPLLELSSAKIASLVKTIKDWPKAEYTTEEEQQIIKDNKWCMEDP